MTIESQESLDLQKTTLQLLKLEQLIRRNKQYIPIEPTDRQALFLMLECKDAFYGGAAGGGKSIALLTGGLLYVHVPGYNAIIIRDTMKNLAMPDSVMDVSFQWLFGTDAHWNDDKKRWTFPSGATLSFGYLDAPRDHFNFQSSQFQYVAIDEAVNIRENQAKYMFSRLRKLKGVEIPIRFRCASNPPEDEQIAKGEWVKQRYISKRTRKKGTVFIPAKIRDNPYLDADDYEDNLMNLDPITRARLKDGDWELRRKGKMFDRSWYEIIEAERVPTELTMLRYWDLAATEPSDSNKKPAYTSGIKMGRDKYNMIYILSIVRFQKNPNYLEKIIRQTADMDGKGVEIWMEQEPGSGGKITISHFRRNILMGYTLRADLASSKGSKMNRAKPFSSYSEAGNVKIVAGAWNEAFFDELEMFPEGEWKDQVDSASGGFSKLSLPKGARIRVI